MQHCALYSYTTTVEGQWVFCLFTRTLHMQYYVYHSLALSHHTWTWHKHAVHMSWCNKKWCSCAHSWTYSGCTTVAQGVCHMCACRLNIHTVKLWPKFTECWCHKAPPLWQSHMHHSFCRYDNPIILSQEIVLTWAFVLSINAGIFFFLSSATSYALNLPKATVHTSRQYNLFCRSYFAAWVAVN